MPKPQTEVHCTMQNAADMNSALGLRGCEAARMRGCVDVWMCGCVDVWMRGCVDAWTYGSAATTEPVNIFV